MACELAGISWSQGLGQCGDEAGHLLQGVQVAHEQRRGVWVPCGCIDGRTNGRTIWFSIVTDRDVIIFCGEKKNTASQYMSSNLKKEKEI